MTGMPLRRRADRDLFDEASKSAEPDSRHCHCADLFRAPGPRPCSTESPSLAPAEIEARASGRALPAFPSTDA